MPVSIQSTLSCPETDQDNSNSASSQITMLQHSLLLCLSCPPHHHLLAKPTETLTGFPTISYPFKYMPRVLDIPNNMPSQVNKFSIHCTHDLYCTYVKHFTHQKRGSQEPLPFQNQTAQPTGTQSTI